MAVISVEPIHDGRTVQDDTSPEETSALRFRVICDDGDKPHLAKTADGIPRKGDPHPDNAAATCRSVSVDQEHNEDFNWVFIVTCNYSTKLPPSGASNPDEIENPLLRPAIYEWSEEFDERPMDKAFDPTDHETVVPVVNSAFEPFDPPPTKETSIRVLTITRNEPTFDPRPLDSTYKGKTNDAAFLGYSAGEVLFASVQATRNLENGVFFWSVMYVFKMRVGGWIDEVLDQGYYQLVTEETTVKKKPILDDEGEPIVAPALLNGSGVPLAVPQTGQPPPEGVYLIFEKYERADFGGLNL